ncbi:anti-sigma B factor antagonist [Saccharopolyspora kobensis]|uniref:Anti-sigma B factor antagonist n=1 Tax=Saccharopolyspora kobensis TaxID=146035 RepID=A0A1H6EE31_9PSEU|nr:STAS domain-containing protein [Saccharopolyspora kobensis]SEG95045.1 anti-sigma B factor antagonist [Saccharopolyspora kobensis]SFD60688.1 anti-sigma B factor antagonist [Saccharopolyspora kobensis]
MTLRTLPARRRAGPRVELHRETAEFDPALHLLLTYPSRDVAVVTAIGDIDTATAPRVSALLWPRLLTKLSAVVLDLSGVAFLGVAGLELITAARTYAPYRDVEFTVVGGPIAVERALRAGELAGDGAPGARHVVA